MALTPGTRLTFDSDAVGASFPTWTPDGTRVAFGSPLLARAFETEPTFTPGALTQLFERDFVGSVLSRQMAVPPDGQRFLLLADATENADGEAALSQIILVQNWFEELRRLVPTN